MAFNKADTHCNSLWISRSRRKRKETARQKQLREAKLASVQIFFLKLWLTASHGGSF
jgi:hypothetical protein